MPLTLFVPFFVREKSSKLNDMRNCSRKLERIVFIQFAKIEHWLIDVLILVDKLLFDPILSFS